jgi:hypothetical protein
MKSGGVIEGGEYVGCHHLRQYKPAPDSVAVAAVRATCLPKTVTLILPFPTWVRPDSHYLLWTLNLRSVSCSSRKSRLASIAG